MKLEGPRIVGVAALIVAAEVAIVLALDGLGQAGVGAGLRVTARSSLLLFVATFVASSTVALWPGPRSKWLLRNRRYVGLSFAVSHAAHGVLIAALAIGWSDAFFAGDNTGRIGGTIGYLFVLAMVLTSTDGARRRLGVSRWRALHTAGMYLLWGIFTFTYAGRAAQDLRYTPLLVLLLVALGVRIAARLRSRRRPRPASA